MPCTKEENHSYKKESMPFACINNISVNCSILNYEQSEDLRSEEHKAGGSRRKTLNCQKCTN